MLEEAQLLFESCEFVTSSVQEAVLAADFIFLHDDGLAACGSLWNDPRTDFLVVQYQLCRRERQYEGLQQQ